MSLRLTAAILAFTTLTACAIPRTAIVAGAATAIAGGLALADANSLAHREEHNIPGALVDGVAAWTEVLVGTSALLLGAGLITSGAVGLGMESSPPPAPLGPLVQMPAPVEPTTASVALAPPGSATAVLTSRSAELATQLWIEVRAGHCARATLAARRLAVLDRDKVIALIDRNPEVASCVAYKM